jgi:hypothetical protein
MMMIPKRSRCRTSKRGCKRDCLGLDEVGDRYQSSGQERRGMGDRYLSSDRGESIGDRVPCCPDAGEEGYG